MTSTELRSARLKAARAIATHTKEEWACMLKYHSNNCAYCGSPENVQKDHIVPIYQGGSDGISNLQPLCKRCNCSKGPCNTDWRRAGWELFVGTWSNG